MIPLENIIHLEIRHFKQFISYFTGLIKLIIVIAIENARRRELWTPSSAHQCTPVVLNYSCCGVAGVRIELAPQIGIVLIG